jgi:hypothetical protein
VYFGFFGGSALLHLLAAHPKVVAVFGIATTVGLLITPLGPQAYLGAGQQIDRLEQKVWSIADEDPRVVEEAPATARRMASRPSAELEPIVRSVLRQCGSSCADLTPAIVIGDDALLHSALVVAEVNRHASQRPMTREHIAQLLASR